MKVIEARGRHIHYQHVFFSTSRVKSGQYHVLNVNVFRPLAMIYARYLFRKCTLLLRTYIPDGQRRKAQNSVSASENDSRRRPREMKPLPLVNKFLNKYFRRLS